MTEKLNNSVFKDLMTDDLKYLFDLFEKYSFELRIAGGAVRDILMNIKPHDIDFATTATPDQMKEIFTKENIRMLHTNGEKHGTITIRLNEKENYEITTLRIDAECDGRHAEVQFTNDWKLDANRRDLTVNSIFLKNDGTIVDFFNGYEDLKNLRIKFVGEPNRRVQEDYLRILRYFRFYGRICANENNHDEQSLQAIKDNSAGLDAIAGERLWVEFKKIVTGKFADSLMKHMVNTNVHFHIGLPKVCNLEEFDRVFNLFKNDLKQMPNSITMVCALLHTIEEFESLNKRMKFSNEEKKLAEFIFKHRNMLDTTTNKATNTCKGDENWDKDLEPYKFILVDNIKDSKIKEKLVELLKYLNRLEIIDFFENWPIPLFPISGEMLIQKNVKKGPIFTKILNELRDLWKFEFHLDTSEETVKILLNKCEILTNSSK